MLLQRSEVRGQGSVQRSEVRSLGRVPTLVSMLNIDIFLLFIILMSIFFPFAISIM